MKKIPLLLALIVTSIGCQKESDPSLKIVKDELLRRGNFYEIQGTIHNPSGKAAENVRISYEVWGNLKGDASHGEIISTNGGLVSARINYIPAGASVDFVATGSAPVMAKETGLTPDPIQATITIGK
jgi:uncharacterized protein (TIGR02588 family)